MDIVRIIDIHVSEHRNSKKVKKNVTKPITLKHSRRYKGQRTMELARNPRYVFQCF